MASRHGLYQLLQSCFISASVLKNSASKRTVLIGVKSLVTMGGVVTDQIVFPSPQDEGKAEVIRTFIKTRPLFAAGNSRGDMEMMNTSVGLKLILNPDAKTPQKVMGGKTVKSTGLLTLTVSQSTLVT